MSNDLIALTVYLIVYAGLHSLLATDTVKARISRLLNGRDRHYRLLYSILSTLALYPLFVMLRGSRTLYQIEGAGPLLLMRALQILGAIGFLLSLREIDLGIFVGFRSPPDTPATSELATDGPYRWCRHPLYFFASVFLLAEPSVTEAYAVFAAWTVLYFWAGSWIEERRLIRAYGNAYISYRASVPHFFPIPYKKNTDSPV